MARKKNAKPEDQVQPAETAAAPAADPVAAEAAAGDQVDVAVDADALPVGDLDTTAGPVLSDDGSAGQAPEGGGKAGETGSAEPADAGEHAAGRPDDNAALELAGAADEHPAADENTKGHPELAPVVNDPAHAGDALRYAMMGIGGNPGEVYPRSEVLADPEPEPLTEDLSVRAGFLAQRSAALALADHQDAPCMTLEQCLSISYLVRKSPDCAAAAMLKHLEIMRIPFEWDRVLGLYAAEIFRTVLRKSDAYLAAVEAAAAPAPERRPRKVPLDETTLELTDEPFALTEEARRKQGR